MKFETKGELIIFQAETEQDGRLLVKIWEGDGLTAKGMDWGPFNHGKSMTLVVGIKEGIL